MELGGDMMVVSEYFSGSISPEIVVTTCTYPEIIVTMHTISPEIVVTTCTQGL